MLRRPRRAVPRCPALQAAPHSLHRGALLAHRGTPRAASAPSSRTSATTWGTNARKACCLRTSAWPTTAWKFKWRGRNSMQVYRSLAEVPSDFGPSALSIGNFDGVHFGHRRILASREGDRRGARLETLGTDLRSTPDPRSGARSHAPPADLARSPRGADARGRHRAGVDPAVHARSRHADARGVRRAAAGESVWAHALCWWATTSISDTGRPAT